MLCWLAASVIARAQTVNVWLTTDDQTQKLKPQAALTFLTGNGGTNVVVVDETQTYQRIVGFGASFTDTTGYILNEVATPSQRNAAMTNLFTRIGGGIGLSFVRNPMGASDLARTMYSYDDLPAGQTDTNLDTFSIAHDQADIIPLVKLALQLNPQLKIMANPWSPPGWMKDSGSMIGGSLLPEMYASFALYFVKYIQAYQAAGIPTHYISLQNEPLYDPPSYPGMPMNAATQTIVLRDYILPALAANNLTNTTVLVYDHNWDRLDYPTTVFSDPAISGSSQVESAWHGYGGTPGVMLTLAANYPTKGQYLTEHSGGTWVSDQVRADFEEIIHVMRSWGKGYIKWNLASDQNYGPHDGGCDNCTPLVYVNTTSGALSYGIEFYTMGHFSKFVLPGAYRIFSSDAAGIITSAFLNPDGSKTLVAFNDTSNYVAFQVQWGGRTFPATLPGFSGATYTWVGTQTGAYTVDAANMIQASSFNSLSGLQTEPSADVTGGYDLGYSSGGSYATFQNVNLANGFTNVIARLAGEGSGGILEFHVDSPAGPMIGSVAIPTTGGWQLWQTATGAVTGGSGVHHLFARFNGYSGVGNLNWFQFIGAEPPLPAPWTNTDIGAVGFAGDATFSGGTYTLNGSGNDIWNGADAFQFMSQPVSGACEIRARVTNIQNTDPWAKAGVMIRESAAPGSVNASVVLSVSNGVSFQIRSSTGGTSTSSVVGGSAVKAPHWLRVTRSGNQFAGYYSSDGTNWTQVGSTATLAMNGSALIGLGVTAHNNASNCVATFDNVSVNQPPSLPSIADQSILAGQTLLVTNRASDADIPAQTLTYNLLNSPPGAEIDSGLGTFVWRPAISQSSATQSLSVVVSDNGVPPMSATQSFAVVVNRPVNPSFYNVSSTNDQFSVWISGDAGPDYLLQTSSNLSYWSTIGTSTPAAMPFQWRLTNAPTAAQFYRVILGP